MGDSVAESLARIALFEDVPSDILEELSKHATRRTYQVGETVLQHLDPSEEVFFIEKGDLIAVLTSPEGREIAFDIMRSGHYFGELSAIDGAGRAMSVHALSPTSVIAMAPGPFREIVADDPIINERFIADLVVRIRQMAQRMYEGMALKVRARLMMELLRLAGITGGGDGDLIELPGLTQSLIASRIGANREAVTRELKRLAADGLITVKRQAISIDNLEDLIEEAQNVV